jgi:hypothetical protein
MTGLTGNPVPVCVADCEAVWLGVGIGEGVPESVGLGDCDCDGEPVGDAVAACVGVGEQTFLIAKRRAPRYGAAVCHVAPSFALTQKP